MKIIICGSITAAQEIIKAKNKLEAKGHQVEIPLGVKSEHYRKRTEVGVSEKAEDKIKNDLVRDYYKKIKKHDIVLIVNPKKRGIRGYIGGNTLIEMAFAHVLRKKLYCLYPLPKKSYVAEMLAMQPTILNGNVDKIV